MKVAVYARVSTTRQQQSQTIEQQLERLIAHVATQPDWDVAEEHIYRDDGYSGATLSRPGLDRLRDQAAMAAFEVVLITAPDRLARKYVHQIVLLDELQQLGCRIEFVDRPMSDDPHDQLLLQIRGAVAEYERTLIAERMRRGRQAKLRSGTLLPWTVAPYGYLLDPEQPRDPNRVRLDPVKAEVVRQIFADYTDPTRSTSVGALVRQLNQQQVPAPNGGLWNPTSVRQILRSPTYAGTAYSGRTRSVPARQRESPLQPVGAGLSKQFAPPEEWIAIPVPAIVAQQTFEAAHVRMEQNKQMARRNNRTHDYLLRGLVSCGQCQLACSGRGSAGYYYYICHGRNKSLRAASGDRCPARYAPADELDCLVWEDLYTILTDPALITQALQRAQTGEWLPQALQARRRTLTEALAQLDRQQARLLDVFLAEVITRDEFERKRHELSQSQHALTQQLRQVDAQAQLHLDIAALSAGIEAFCQRVQPTLDHLTFAQRRQLVVLLIDRVIVNDDQVEIRYVVPTGPKGEQAPFCHLRKDYFATPSRGYFSRLKDADHARLKLAERRNRVAGGAEASLRASKPSAGAVFPVPQPESQNLEAHPRYALRGVPREGGKTPRRRPLRNEPSRDERRMTEDGVAHSVVRHPSSVGLHFATLFCVALLTEEGSCPCASGGPAPAPPSRADRQTGSS